MRPRRLVALLNAYTEGMSGGDAWFIEIAKRLRGFELVVVTSALGEAACRERGLVTCFWLTTREARFTGVIATYLLRTFKGLLLTRRIRSGDLVYATSDFLPDVLPAFGWKIRHRHVGWVQKIHHMIPLKRRIPHAAQKVSHMLIKAAADVIIVNSALLRDELLRHGFPPERVRVNYPGIDLRQFHAPAAEGPPLYDGVFLGRLHPSKGIFDLVDIWQNVRAARPSATLAVIGRGERRTIAALQEKIAAAGLTHHINLLGFLETAAVIDVLRRSRVFVFPSREEGFGIAILEAMASGLPVVAWDLPVYREVFPQGVVRVPVGAHETFASEVVRLLASADLRHQLVLAGQRLLPRYDWDAVALREAKAMSGMPDTAAIA
jgi:glycosyltransferase involved in cell wall biosynthesis